MPPFYPPHREPQAARQPIPPASENQSQTDVPDSNRNEEVLARNQNESTVPRQYGFSVVQENTVQFRIPRKPIASRRNEREATTEINSSGSAARPLPRYQRETEGTQTKDVDRHRNEVVLGISQRNYESQLLEGGFRETEVLVVHERSVGGGSLQEHMSAEDFHRYYDQIGPQNEDLGQRPMENATRVAGAVMEHTAFGGLESAGRNESQTNPVDGITETQIAQVSAETAAIQLAESEALQVVETVAFRLSETTIGQSGDNTAVQVSETTATDPAREAEAEARSIMAIIEREIAPLSATDILEQVIERLLRGRRNNVAIAVEKFPSYRRYTDVADADMDFGEEGDWFTIVSSMSMGVDCAVAGNYETGKKHFARALNTSTSLNEFLWYRSPDGRITGTTQGDMDIICEPMYALLLYQVEILLFLAYIAIKTEQIIEMAVFLDMAICCCPARECKEILGMLRGYLFYGERYYGQAMPVINRTRNVDWNSFLLPSGGPTDKYRWPRRWPVLGKPELGPMPPEPWIPNTFTYIAAEARMSGMPIVIISLVRYALQLDHRNLAAEWAGLLGGGLSATHYIDFIEKGVRSLYDPKNGDILGGGTMYGLHVPPPNAEILFAPYTTKDPHERAGPSFHTERIRGESASYLPETTLYDSLVCYIRKASIGSGRSGLRVRHGNHLRMKYFFNKPDGLFKGTSYFVEDTKTKKIEKVDGNTFDYLPYETICNLAEFFEKEGATIPLPEERHQPCRDIDDIWCTCPEPVLKHPPNSEDDFTPGLCCSGFYKDQYFICGFLHPEYNVYTDGCRRFIKDKEIRDPPVENYNRQFMVCLLAGNLKTAFAAYDEGHDPNENADIVLLATLENSFSAISRLLLFPIDIDVQDKNGDTALHKAVMRFFDKEGITELLLRNGASPAIKNTKGETAFDCVDNRKGIWDAMTTECDRLDREQRRMDMERWKRGQEEGRGNRRRWLRPKDIRPTDRGPLSSGTEWWRLKMVEYDARTATLRTLLWEYGMMGENWYHHGQDTGFVHIRPVQHRNRL